MIKSMKILLLLVLSALASYAQVDPLDGLWQGFKGESRHVSNQLVALAEAIPADKYASLNMEDCNGEAGSYPVAAALARDRRKCARILNRPISHAESK